MNSRKDLGAKVAQLWPGHASASGRRWWRGLEELASSEAFQELMRREFPEQADVWPDALSRRRFLTVMGASLALAGVGGCSVKPAPPGTIVPYVDPPEEILPGQPLFFATTCSDAGDVVGLLVESHMGRPTKVEGNPDHPASLGATRVFDQAEVLALYDPDRSRTVTSGGEVRGWEDFERAMQQALESHRRSDGAGLRVLTQRVVSPTLGHYIQQLLEAFPQARWHQYDPLNDDQAYQATQWAFGRPASPVYDFRQADVIVSLDADFLTQGPGHLRHARHFMDRRRVRTSTAAAASAAMNRLYVAETAVTPTGAIADHRLALPARDVQLVARQLAERLGVLPRSEGGEPSQRWVEVAARDLAEHRGRCLVLAGPRQPAAVHLLAYAINHQLDNVGSTVRYMPPVDVEPVEHVGSLAQLVDAIRDGAVTTLLIVGGNPVYDAPADLEFGRHLPRVPLRIRLGLYQDETSRLCHWHLPQSHFLESWGDARAFDGTVSTVQPLIEPLYAGRSALELVAMLVSSQYTPGRQLVRQFWRQWWEERANGEGDFEAFWQESLHDGLIAGTAFDGPSLRLQQNWREHIATGPAPGWNRRFLELNFQGDPTIFDGRFANNGWLQELPKPITKLTWDNAAVISPATAARLQLHPVALAHGGEHGGYHVPVVELRLDERTVRAPVWVMPGHADDTVTVSLGYGRWQAGQIGGREGEPVGFNAYRLRSSREPWFRQGLRLVRTGSTFPLACTQVHHSMDDRDVVRAGTLGRYRQDPEHFVESKKASDEKKTEQADEPITLYEPFSYEPPGHKWGMVIDMTTCIGCNACVVACQAENNIPVVGKDQVLFGREMHWLRIDRYMRGQPEKPDEFYFQPVPCMHCEQAPCEYVCPVEATVHSAEGLNDMIYNRCVGTRFCSNNCPYKVRRFNFLEYSDFDATPRRLQYNPDVTVRSRGVMEKCTYCVQRIRHAEISAQAANRPIRDGEILTACQAACPSKAIVFGDLNDPQSTVAQWKGVPLEYALLAELNTRPRTTYLAALRNPHPDLEDA